MKAEGTLDSQHLTKSVSCKLSLSSLLTIQVYVASRKEIDMRFYSTQEKGKQKKKVP